MARRKRKELAVQQTGETIIITLEITHTSALEVPIRAGDAPPYPKTKKETVRLVEQQLAAATSSGKGGAVRATGWIKPPGQDLTSNEE